MIGISRSGRVQGHLSSIHADAHQRMQRSTNRPNVVDIPLSDLGILLYLLPMYLAGLTGSVKQVKCLAGLCNTFETAKFAEGEEDVVAVRKLGHFKHQLLRRYEGSIRALLRLF